MPCMLCCCAVPECSAGGFRSLVKQSRSSGYLNLLDRFLWPVLELISGRAPPAAPRQKLEPCCLHLDEAVPDEAVFNDSRRSSKSLVLLSNVSSSITDVQHGVCSVRVVFSCSSSRVLLQLLIWPCTAGITPVLTCCTPGQTLLRPLQARGQSLPAPGGVCKRRAALPGLQF